MMERERTGMKKLVAAGLALGAAFAGGPAGAEEGAFRALQSVERQYSASIEGPEGRIEAAHWTGTHTVLETDGPPFGTGSSRVVYLARYWRDGGTLKKLISPSTVTDADGDRLFMVAERSNTPVGRAGIGGGTGKYAGVKGSCRYVIEYVGDEQTTIVVDMTCDWAR